MNDGYIIDPNLSADKERVKKIVELLRKAYEDYLNETGGHVTLIDGIMAAHNFHKLIISDIAKYGPEHAEYLWKLSLATWQKTVDYELRKLKPGASN